MAKPLKSKKDAINAPVCPLEPFLARKIRCRANVGTRVDCMESEMLLKKGVILAPVEMMEVFNAPKNLASVNMKAEGLTLDPLSAEVILSFYFLIMRLIKIKIPLKKLPNY